MRMRSVRTQFLVPRLGDSPQALPSGSALSGEGQPAIVPGRPGEAEAEAEEGEGSAALRSLPANLTVCFHHAGVPSPRTMSNSPGSLLSVCLLATGPGELGARGCK